MLSTILNSIRNKLVRKIYGDHNGQWTRYLTRLLLTPETRWGHLRLHVFHRGDADPDLNDHPNDFWTFPLTSYVEEVRASSGQMDGGSKRRQTVQAWRWHYRPAEYAHRVVSRDGTVAENLRKIVTLVWWKPKRRAWGFWVEDRWIPWREYVYGEEVHSEA